MIVFCKIFKHIFYLKSTGVRSLFKNMGFPISFKKMSIEALDLR